MSSDAHGCRMLWSSCVAMIGGGAVVVLEVRVRRGPSRLPFVGYIGGVGAVVMLVRVLVRREP